MREELRKKWVQEVLSAQEVEEVISYAQTLSDDEVVSFWESLASISPVSNEPAVKNIKAVHVFFGPKIVKIFKENPQALGLSKEEAANNAR